MQNFATTTDLMVYQEAAVSKVSPSRVAGLFMEMGTGKSRTAIESVKRRRFKIDHAVWFCPVSLKETVKQEILKHTDSQDIYVFNHKTTEDNIPKASWYVIGIESMSSSTRVILTTNKIITERTFVILDESSYIKGHRSLRTERITLLSKIAKYRLILTGTPISQGIIDLFSQMRFLSPKILGYNSFYSFAANHLEYSEKFPGMIVRAHNTEYIAAKIKPYVYQVIKEECLTLPEKLYETRYFSLTKDQWYAYEEAKDEMLSLVDDDGFDSVTIFRLFGVLQQIVSGFWHRRMCGHKLKSTDKFTMLEFAHRRTDTLAEVICDIPAGDKIIIWAKFQYDIKQIQATLTAEYGPDSLALFHGGIPEKKRQDELARFRKDARFFLATQSCGGHGLTLNEAHYVIFYNNGFKYSERLQAEDRCHRIGQEHNVTYIDIHAGGTIDDRIWKSLVKKENVADSFKSEVDRIKDDKVKLREMIKAL
jgi:SNF2 family DNA or RNA helicase